MRTALALALAIVFAGATAAIGPGEAGSEAGPPSPDGEGRYLPDLVQILPGRLEVFTRGSRRGRRTLLAFGAAAENFGAGPLIVKGSRRSRSSSTMTATQVVMRSDGSKLSVPNVGTLRFVKGGGHSHWHLRGFMRFELRTTAGAPLGRRDRKTGFCLGDRYDPKPDESWPGEPGSPVYTGRCGLNRPGLLRVRQGISVGYGDDYGPRLEGQYIDITGLATGNYVLVQRVNPNGRLLDLHSDNDVSSLLFELTHGRRTRARILEWCTSTDSCPAPRR